MYQKNRKKFSIILLVGILSLSAIITSPVYAEEALPPETESIEMVDAGTETQPTPAEEAPLPSTGEVDSASSEEQPILEQLPENTEVIVLDEDGQALPLVTEEAQAAIDDVIDPVWCPVGVAPQDNAGGCTIAYTNLKDLIDALMNGTAGVIPNTAGVIWIESGNDASAGNILLDGSDANLGNMENFALTLQGGWNGTFGSKTIVGNSTFNDRITITNWNAAVTINDIVIDSATGVGLTVETTGNVVLKNVQSNNNTNTGASIDNTTGTGNVTITNSKFINNNVNGLFVNTKGTITIKDLTANDNTGFGASLDNDTATTAKTVSISGSNIFNGNGLGLYVASYGAVTINNITASNNSNVGADIDHDNVPGSTAGVTLTGTNIFNDNNGNGLSIITFGVIKLNNIFANSNNGSGAYLFNSGAIVGAPGVTLTGTNEFKYNDVLGLSLTTKGIITGNNISANFNGNQGASLNNITGNGAAVTLTGTNSFSENFGTGLNIQSTGVVSLNSITANFNGLSNSFGSGVSISNHTLVLFKGVMLTGVNSISSNYDTNLVVVSSGAITLNSITANNSETGYGVNLSNTISGSSKPMAVTINGTSNSMSFNRLTGLEIITYGAVTLNNITASNNGLGAVAGSGVVISNAGSDTPQNVTLKGTNKFSQNYDSGIYIQSKGIVTTNSIYAGGNGDYGVYIQNTASTTASGVTMTGTNEMSSNNLDNLHIESKGNISLSNILAYNSNNGHGAYILNVGAATPKTVTITGTNEFTFNDDMGLYIFSLGAITLNNINASNNGDHGALLDNSFSSTKAGVTLNGINSFSGNLMNSGLVIQTLGNVKINSVTAYSNQGYGVYVNGNNGTNTGSVTITGNNDFYANASHNLYINVYGAVTISNINSTQSTAGSGAVIDNRLGSNTAPKPVTLTGTNVFSNNDQNGLAISTYGAVTLNNITARFNTNWYGVDILNTGTATGKPANVTLNGNNQFFSNGSDGLQIESDGLIKTNNLNASSNGGYGAYLVNNTGTVGVTLTGTNLFDQNNFIGLNIESKGAITLNNITASNNNSKGAFISNLASGFATPKPVTLTGNNVFERNNNTGLEIDTYGAITTNNITANQNGTGAVYGLGAELVNADGTNTIVANITMNGNNTFNNNLTGGLFTNAYGALKINNLTTSGNSGTGAELTTSNAPSNAFGVTLTGKVVTEDNSVRGLTIYSKGTVTINNLTTRFNSNDGLYVDNTSAGASTPKPVTLTGINIATGNTGYGFNIFSYGVVTINKITANQNIIGNKIENQSATNPANVVIAGYGVFTNNTSTGLLINSKGAVTLTNIEASNNTFSHGIFVNNSFGTGAITMTGVNTFANNGSDGVNLLSSGLVSVTKIFADQNNGSGLLISTTSTVTVSCGVFILNTNFGWQVTSGTLATIKGVFTAGNISGDYSSSAPVVFSRACPLP